MSAKNRQQNGGKSKTDFLLWTLLILIVCAALVANYFYSDIVWSLRLVGWIVVAGLVIFIAAYTKAGRALWKFTKESKQEMRKVVWPTRKETIRTTMIVMALVVLTAVILWGVDSILLIVIGWLTGQRG